jgi:hypothetical protein
MQNLSVFVGVLIYSKRFSFSFLLLLFILLIMESETGAILIRLQEQLDDFKDGRARVNTHLNTFVIIYLFIYLYFFNSYKIKLTKIK